MLMAAAFQHSALAALMGLLKGEQGNSSCPHGTNTPSAEPACPCCFSSRHNAGADPQAADPAQGQEQARTLAGAEMLTSLPRGE